MNAKGKQAQQADQIGAMNPDDPPNMEAIMNTAETETKDNSDSDSTTDHFLNAATAKERHEFLNNNTPLCEFVLPPASAREASNAITRLSRILRNAQLDQADYRKSVSDTEKRIKAVVATDTTLTNEAKRSAAINQFLDADDAYQRALHELDVVDFTMKSLNVEIDYFRREFQILMAEGRLSTPTPLPIKPVEAADNATK